MSYYCDTILVKQYSIAILALYTFALFFMLVAGLEKSSVLPVLDRFLKLKTDLFLDKS